VVDGERGPRGRHDPPPTAHCNGSRRWDREDEDDEDGRRGRRQHKAGSWSSRLFRSVSRAPRDRDRSEPRRDAHDRGSNTGGRRRHHVRGSCTDDLAHPPGPCLPPLRACVVGPWTQSGEAFAPSPWTPQPVLSPWAPPAPRALSGSVVGLQPRVPGGRWGRPLALPSPHGRRCIASEATGAERACHRKIRTTQHRCHRQ
jgi:hypothetical protein